MNGWQADKYQSQDKPSEQIKRILARAFHVSVGSVVDALPIDDTQRNTDFFIRTPSRDLRVACRVRQFKYLERYWHQFTLRSKRSKNKTELAKVLEGYGDYIFYGFFDERGSEIAHWIIGRLDAFREAYRHRSSSIATCPISNADGSSDFNAYDWPEIDGFLFVAKTGYLPAGLTTICNFVEGYESRWDFAADDVYELLCERLPFLERAGEIECRRHNQEFVCEFALFREETLYQLLEDECAYLDELSQHEEDRVTGKRAAA